MLNKYNFLANTQQSISLYIIKAAILTTIFGSVISILLTYFFPNASSPDFDLNVYNTIGAVVIAPLFETLLMLPIFIIARKITPNILLVALISAIFWGGVHSLLVPLWGIGVFPLFFIMSLAYQYWDEHSIGHALLVVMAIHAINNALAIFFLSMQGYF
jgi:hypothetical protein